MSENLFEDDDHVSGICVRAIRRIDCEPFIIGIHYAHRWPSITYAFGLFDDDELIGCVTYGTPPSSTLRTGICGVENANDVLELNRLCLKDNIKNHASMLVGRSLKLLPKGKIIVSYADSSQGHIGYVYQATNFLYCGLSAKQADWVVRGLEHLHHISVSDEFKGCLNRTQRMHDKYGDDLYLKPRPRKHRYVYITGGSKIMKEKLKLLNYGIEPYPKLNNSQEHIVAPRNGSSMNLELIPSCPL